jgi:nitrogen fixation protein FixH
MSEFLEKRNQKVPCEATELTGSSASRSAWLWGSLVTAFLILQLVIGGLAFNLATGDPSVAVMPDYHERALNWDDEMARRQRSDQLGWRATLTWGAVAASETGESGREVVVHVVDTDGAAVTGGDASIRFFHHTRAGDVSSLKLQERAPGAYVWTLPMEKPGLWDIEFSLARGPGEAFWHQETLDIPEDILTGVDFSTDAAE